MSNDAAHANHVYESANRSSAAASSPIVASWRRCMTMHHLAPEENRKPIFLSEAEFRRARDEASALLAESTDEIDRIFSTVGRAGCCLLLTDAKGVALERRGAAGDDDDFRKAALVRRAVERGECSAPMASAPHLPTSGRRWSIATSISSAPTSISPAPQRRSATTGAGDGRARHFHLPGRHQRTDLFHGDADRARCRSASRAICSAARSRAPRILIVPPGQSTMLSLLAVDQDDIILGQPALHDWRCGSMMRG